MTSAIGTMQTLQSIRWMSEGQSRHWSRYHFGASRTALAMLVGFYPNVVSLTGRTFKSAFAQVRSSMNHADKPHRFTARRAARAVGDKHH